MKGMKGDATAATVLHFSPLTISAKGVVPITIPALHCIGAVIALEIFQEISFPAD